MHVLMQPDPALLNLLARSQISLSAEYVGPMLAAALKVYRPIVQFKNPYSL